MVHFNILSYIASTHNNTSIYVFLGQNEIVRVRMNPFYSIWQPAALAAGLEIIHFK